MFSLIAVKYEQHAGQSQKKRLLAMAQNECLLGPNPAAVIAQQQNQAATNQLKQEPAEFSASTASLNYDYQPQNYEHQKRSSWVGPSSSSSSTLVAPPTAHSHHHHHSSSSKRDTGYSSSNNVSNGQSSSGSGINSQPPQQPPVAHAKNNTSSSSTSSSWNGTPIYHHHLHSQPPPQQQQQQQNLHHHHHRQQQPQNTTPLGPSNNSPLGLGTQVAAALLQPQQAADLYAQTELYRRPTVFVSHQPPYQAYNRVVPPPPAHNGSSRQVIRNPPFIVPPLFCNKYR